MKKAMIYFLLLAGTLLLAGCQKEGRNGGEIHFTAATAPQTKTAYGDYENDSNGNPVWQRIDWKANDRIRIASDKATHRYNSNQYWSDYVVTTDGTPKGRKSEASIDNEDGNGLVWDESATEAHTFWAMYPAPARGTANANLTAGKLEMSLPATQAAGEEMNYAFMFARTTASLPASKYEKNVTLYFNPAFTAFEFHLKSLDEEIELVNFTLESGAKNLSGKLVAEITGTGETATLGEPTISDGGKTVKITFPANTKITKNGDEQVFTLFALPQAYNDLTLKFNVKVGGIAETRSFPLKNTSGWISFAPFKKHRITGLRMPGSMWKLEIDGDVLPWNGYTETIDSQVSVEGKVQITGDIESVYMDVDSDYKNHYKSAFGYSKFYQIRTLDRGTTPIRPGEDETPRVPLGHFEMTFRPTAPVGGYWQLIPQFKDGDTESPKHFRFEVVLPGSVTSDQLTGPIINEAITVKIYPKDYESSDMNVYEVWFTAYFSPSKSFNPLISADSEFQDVHSDGRFSYWTFRLTQDQSKIAQE